MGKLKVNNENPEGYLGPFRIAMYVVVACLAFTSTWLMEDVATASAMTAFVVAMSVMGEYKNWVRHLTPKSDTQSEAIRTLSQLVFWGAGFVIIGSFVPEISLEESIFVWVYFLAAILVFCLLHRSTLNTESSEKKKN